LLKCTLTLQHRAVGQYLTQSVSGNIMPPPSQVNRLQPTSMALNSFLALFSCMLTIVKCCKRSRALGQLSRCADNNYYVAIKKPKKKNPEFGERLQGKCRPYLGMNPFIRSTRWRAEPTFQRL